MNGAASAPPGTDRLRRAVRRAMGLRSLRDVASEIGVSHTGLRGFLRGARPHPHTRLKLERWLTHEGARERIREAGRGYSAPPDRESYEVARSIIAALVAEADPGRAAPAAAELAELVRRNYLAAGREPPDWLNESD